MRVFGFGKDKYVIILAKKINGRYSKIAQKKADPTQATVRYKGNSYPINYEQVLYRDGLKNYILIDVDNYQQVKDTEAFSQISASLIDSILARNIVSQLVTRLSPSTLSGSILLIVMSISIGILAGYFIGNVYPLSQIQNAIGGK